MRRTIFRLMAATVILLIMPGVALSSPSGGADFVIAEASTLPGNRLPGDMNGVDASGENNVWAIGGGDRVYQYDGNGWIDRSWTPSFGSPGILYGVSVLDTNHVWAVGDGAHYGRGADIIFWNGSSWTQYDSGTADNLYAVSAYDVSHVWAVGENGRIMKFDGTSWSSQVSPYPTIDLYGVCAVTSEVVYAVGESGNVLRTVNGGANWSDTGVISSETFLAVSASSTNNVWVVGEGDEAWLYDGANWSSHHWTPPMGDKSTLFAVHALDASHVWAVGDGALMGRGGDWIFWNGSSWSRLNSNTAQCLYGVVATGTDKAWVVGTNSVFITNTPAGQSVKTWLGPSVGVVFETASIAGTTNAYSASDPAIPGYSTAPGTCWDISTTTAFSGKAEVSLSYHEGAGGLPESRLRLLHNDGGTWKDITSELDILNNVVKGETDSFSAFAIAVEDSTTFYFAEGYTGPGFQEYLCLGQPVNAPLNVTVTYLFNDGSPPMARDYVVPALSRLTIDVNDVVGGGREVSMKCVAAEPFVAERPVYFSYGSGWSGGHDVVGATATSNTWYFAEGYTGPGFDEWVCVLNPGDEAAELTFRFQTQEEGEKVVEGGTVNAHSRASFKVNDLLKGGYYSASLKLESTLPVVVERPMYFNYAGRGNHAWTGGHCVMGAPYLYSQYYFAEGTTRGGFEEWLTLQNPGDSGIVVEATYMLGTGETKDVDYPVPASKRSTIFVPEEVGEGQDVSVFLTCASPFLAERPMYFAYPGLGNWGWTGGHCVIGSLWESPEWFFAEGYTGDGFEQWICIQNPGGTPANVTLTYYPEGAAPIPKPAFTVAGNSRFTVPVNTDAGPGLAISTKVVSDQPVICERPMYFDFRGLTGGHDVVGYIP